MLADLDRAQLEEAAAAIPAQAEPDMASIQAQIDQMKADYEARMHAFQAEQNMRNIAWTEQAATRVKDLAALTGRHVLTSFLKGKKFGLK